jgi:hypothetical protein
MNTPVPRPSDINLTPSASSTRKLGFWKRHFGNPEADEVYGATDNDYETEPEQIKDEKRMGRQAIWFLGAAAFLTLMAYLLQGWFS